LLVSLVLDSIAIERLAARRLVGALRCRGIVGDAVALLGGPAFDFALAELFGPLLLRGEALRLDPLVLEAGTRLLAFVVGPDEGDDEGRAAKRRATPRQEPVALIRVSADHLAA